MSFFILSQVDLSTLSSNKAVLVTVHKHKIKWLFGLEFITPTDVINAPSRLGLALMIENHKYTWKRIKCFTNCQGSQDKQL